MTDQATFQLLPSNSCVIIAATGEIDIANIDQFRSFVLAAARNGQAPMVISLEKVSYVDSHTVETLVELGKRLRTNRRSLRVVAPSQSPSGRILRTAGMDAALALFESLQDATQASESEG